MYACTVKPVLVSHPTVWLKCLGDDKVAVQKAVKCAQTVYWYMKYCLQRPCKTDFSVSTQKRFDYTCTYLYIEAFSTHELPSNLL